MAIKELLEQKIKELKNNVTNAVIINKKDYTRDTIIYGKKAPIPEALK